MNPYDDIELVEPFNIEEDTTIEYVGNTSGYDGHCFSKGTKIRLISGKTKNVEEINIGDEIATPYGSSKVIELFSGRGQLYKVSDSRKPHLNFICSSKHLLYFEDQPSKTIKTKYRNLAVMPCDKGYVITAEDFYKIDNSFKSKVRFFYKTKLNNFKSQIYKIEKYGIDNYYGFRIENPIGLILLENGMITHNSLRSYSYYPNEIKRWEDLKYLNKNQKFYKDPKTNKYYTEEEIASVD